MRLDVNRISFRRACQLRADGGAKYANFQANWSCCHAKLVAVDRLAGRPWNDAMVPGTMLWGCDVIMFLCQACRCGRLGAATPTDFA